MNAVPKAKYVRGANSSPVISLKSNPSEVEFHKGMHCQFQRLPGWGHLTLLSNNFTRSRQRLCICLRVCAFVFAFCVPIFVFVAVYLYLIMMMIPIRCHLTVLSNGFTGSRQLLRVIGTSILQIGQMTSPSVFRQVIGTTSIVFVAIYFWST